MRPCVAAPGTAPRPAGRSRHSSPTRPAGETGSMSPISARSVRAEHRPNADHAVQHHRDRIGARARDDARPRRPPLPPAPSEHVGRDVAPSPPRQGVTCTASSHVRPRGGTAAASAHRRRRCVTAGRGASAPDASAAAPADGDSDTPRGALGSAAAARRRSRRCHGARHRPVGVRPGDPSSPHNRPSARLARVDDTDRRAGRRQRIDERPRRATRFDGEPRRRADRAAELREPFRRPRKPGLPYPFARRPNRTRLKERLVQINPDILCAPWAVLLSRPGACVVGTPHYLRRCDWATALSSDQIRGRRRGAAATAMTNDR